MIARFKLLIKNMVKELLQTKGGGDRRKKDLGHKFREGEIPPTDERKKARRDPRREEFRELHRRKAEELRQRFIMTYKKVKYPEHKLENVLPAIEQEVDNNAIIKQYIEDTARLEVRSEINSQKDSLTGLLNRDALYVRFATEMEFLKEMGEDNEVAVVVFFDIDDFKQINDNLGHLAGDEVLKEIAKKLKGNDKEKGILRIWDVATRLGGDEFMLILNRIKKGEVQNTINRIRESFSEIKYQYQANKEWNMKISLGFRVIDKDEPAPSLSEITSWLDDAMYVAKDLGKGQAVEVTINKKFMAGGKEVQIIKDEEFYIKKQLGKREHQEEIEKAYRLDPSQAEKLIEHYTEIGKTNYQLAQIASK
jgi:diguanylate cyclase (GGDEF)-like protein